MITSKNRLILSAPGSGKTTLICKEVLSVPRPEGVLITTYTDTNAEEIRARIIEKRGSLPPNITVLPWFTFLLKHGVRPYQGAMDESLHDRKVGFFLTSERSGRRGISSAGYPIYWGEENFYNYYFTKDLKIYSDKIAKFIYSCNKNKVKGEIIGRLARIYSHIYIDEVQDLAGWDLELIKELSKSTPKMTLVGDPRQTIYLTNPSSKHLQYRNGRIDLFLKKSKRLNYTVDETTLQRSHRNNQQICNFSSLLYPDLDATQECECVECKHSNNHKGVFVLRTKDISDYLKAYPECQILKNSNAKKNELTFGISKGKTFDRVLILPTKPIRNFMQTGDLKAFTSEKAIARFYVAITRARHSVAIVYDYTDKEQLPFDEVIKWSS